MRKTLAALLTVLSLGLAVFAVLLCVYAEKSSPKLNADPGDSTDTLTGFFDCLKAEKWEEAYSYLYNYSTLGFEAEPGDHTSALFWEAQKKAWDFRMSPDWELDGASVKRKITVQGLDMNALQEAISARVQDLLAEAVESAVFKSDIYTDAGDYREDVAMAALRQAEEDVLLDASSYSKDRDVTVELRLYDGKWYIVAGKELISALTSGAVR